MAKKKRKSTITEKTKREATSKIKVTRKPTGGGLDDVAAEMERPSDGAIRSTVSGGMQGTGGETRQPDEEGEKAAEERGEQAQETDQEAPKDDQVPRLTEKIQEEAKKRDPNDISPSLKKGEPGNNKLNNNLAEISKNDIKKINNSKLGKQYAKEQRNKYLKELAKKAAKAAADAASKALAAIGWPYILAGCLIIFLIILLVFGSLACISQSGYFGKSKPMTAGADNADVKKIMDYSQQAAKGGGGSTGFMSGKEAGTLHKIDFLNPRDAEFVKAGQIDERLAAALVYLADKHEHIRISHIISGYEDMPTDPESGTFHDSQIKKNISAHKEGLAADIDEIDYVKQQCNCGPDIPVSVMWQTMNSSPITGALPNNILGGINGATDLLNGDIRTALEQMGVSGLGQAGLADRLSQVAGIGSITDLANQDVINQLRNIGINGVDNPLLQGGLGQLRNIQDLVNLNPQNIDQLMSGRGAEILGRMGISTGDIRDNINLFQQAQGLSYIGGIDDLNQPQIRSLLSNMGVDVNNGDIGNALNNIASANRIMNWSGSLSNQVVLDALSNLSAPTEQEYLGYYHTFLNARRSLENISGTIEADIDNFAALSRLNIDIDNPQAQQVFDTFRSAYQTLNWQGSFYDAQLNAALNRVGVRDIQAAQQLIENFQAADLLSTFQGDVIQPQVQSALDRFGLNSDVLISGQLRNADPMAIVERATNLDERFPETFQQFKNMQTLIGITDIGDIRNLGHVKDALNNLGINLPENYSQIANLGSLSTLMNVQNLSDINTDIMQRAANQLNLPSNFQNAIGYMGSVQSLTQINSPLDLARPQFQAALSNLGLTSPGLQTALGQMGSVGTLMNIQSPQDLFSAGSINAMSSLGILNANTAGLFGQLGAVQSLMSIQSFSDLLNPNTIMALNSLGIISMANPATAYLMAAQMIGSFLGISIPGLGGECDGDTSCYGPTARTNIHKMIEELLQFPYDMKNTTYYKVTQLITFSKDRDVTPFSAKLDELYGKGRPANYGLFAMPEAKDHLHIGY